MIHWIKKIKYSWYPQHRLITVIRALLLMFFFMISFTFFFAYFENSALSEAWWQAWQTQTTIGYGNQPATTTGGRIISMIFGSAGLVYLGIFVAKLADYVYFMRDRKRRGVRKNMFKNSIILFNFQGVKSTKRFIQEIRMDSPYIPFCIVDQELDALPIELSDLGRIHFVSGAYTDEKTYERIQVQHAKVVVIFPRDKTNSDSDGFSQLISQLVLRNCSSECRINVELVHLPNRWLFNQERVQFIDANLGILALAQECIDPHTSSTVEQLLLNSSGAIPVTVEPLFFAGKSWSFLERYLYEDSLDNSINRFSLLALVQNRFPILNVPAETTINASDKIVLISSLSGRDRWEKWNKQLQKKS